MARKRKRLVIHIGMHKTGSTTIQRFLSRNRLVLRLAGVLYPESCGADGRREPKHNALFAAISHEADHGAPHPVLGPSADLVEAMAGRITSSRAQIAILSAEGFSGEKPAFSSALAPLGEYFDTRILVFLRRPDDWVESFYRQMILSREVREARSLEAFLQCPATRAHLDFCGILGWWAERFGREAVCALPYQADAGRDLARAFLSAAGLPTALARLPHGGGHLNASAPRSAVEALWRENGGAGAFRTSLTPEERIELATRLLGEWSGSSNTVERAFSPPPFILSMLEKILDENRDVQENAAPFFGQN